MTKVLFIQAILSFAVIAFCCYQIDKGVDTGGAWATLGGITGFWLPSPIEKS